LLLRVMTGQAVVECAPDQPGSLHGRPVEPERVVRHGSALCSLGEGKRHTGLLDRFPVDMLPMMFGARLIVMGDVYASYVLWRYRGRRVVDGVGVYHVVPVPVLSVVSHGCSILSYDRRFTSTRPCSSRREPQPFLSRRTLLIALKFHVFPLRH